MTTDEREPALFGLCVVNKARPKADVAAVVRSQKRAGTKSRPTLLKIKSFFGGTMEARRDFQDPYTAFESFTLE